MSDDEATRAHGATTDADVSPAPASVTSTVSVADGDVQLKRQFDELHELFLETQQVTKVLPIDRRELIARHGQVQKQLERVHMENEYLMGELSQYAASDLESDQSDIELHFSSHSRKALPSLAEAPGVLFTVLADAVVSKPKSKSGAKPTESMQLRDAAAASKPKRKRLSSIATTPSSSSLPTAPKKASATS